jgi:hypothetical protein
MQFVINIITQLQPLHTVHDASSDSQCSAVHCLAAVAMSMMVDHSPAGRARHPTQVLPLLRHAVFIGTKNRCRAYFAHHVLDVTRSKHCQFGEPVTDSMGKATPRTQTRTV